MSLRRPIDSDLLEKMTDYLDGFRDRIHYVLPNLYQQFNVVSFPGGVLVDFSLKRDAPHKNVFYGEARSTSEAFNAVGADVRTVLEHREFSKSRKQDKAGLYGINILNNHVYVVATQGDGVLTYKNGRKDARSTISGLLHLLDQEEKKKKASAAADALFNKTERKKTKPSSWLGKFKPW